MLVLSRKPGEKILIGEDIAVTVVRIDQNTVRLGFDAPKELNIVRDELIIELPAEFDGDDIAAGEIATGEAAEAGQEKEIAA